MFCSLLFGVFLQLNLLFVSLCLSGCHYSAGWVHRGRDCSSDHERRGCRQEWWVTLQRLCLHSCCSFYSMLKSIIIVMQSYFTKHTPENLFQLPLSMSMENQCSLQRFYSHLKTDWSLNIPAPLLSLLDMIIFTSVMGSRLHVCRNDTWPICVVKESLQRPNQGNQTDSLTTWPQLLPWEYTVYMCVCEWSFWSLKIHWTTPIKCVMDHT